MHPAVRHVLLVGFLVYVAGCMCYELSLAGITISVLRDTRDYHVTVGNATINIEDLPNHVYYDTNIMITVFLPLPMFVLGLAVWELLYYAKHTEVFNPPTFAWFSLAAGLLAQFTFATFITAKYIHMSETDRTLWDEIDPRYMWLYRQMLVVVILIAVGTVLSLGFVAAKRRSMPELPYSQL